jgi:predicted anti-sigma-YlaC factor YlaD
MNCVQAGDVLADFLYQDLAPSQRAALEEHLADCSTCAEQLRRMQAATRWLDRAQTPLSEPLNPVPLLVRQAGQLRRQARRWRRGAVAAAALAAAVVLAIASIDHVRWENKVLTVRFSNAAPPPKLASVDANVSERLRRAESSINVLNASLSRLADEQRQFVADVHQAMEGTTVLTAGSVPANEALLAEFGLGPDDY